ncbi:RDD family protein [Thermomonospora echinospora]|uniref:RDD family protein n=1 Tax=Thermomonospora echinospora TaxID=1992 RepID=A0A1H6BEW4_9ACTN|nr:RDD family protein [Thermomonospora echinospora]SEG59182.1 RDD family protein [Thermomonospora echinospora]
MPPAPGDVMHPGGVAPVADAPSPDAPAPVLRRFAAWALDGAVVFGLFLLIGGFSYARIADHLRAESTQMAALGPWDIVSSHGDVTGLARGAATDAWNGTVSIVVQGFVLLVLAQLVYQFTALAWRGRTLGKAVAGLQVRPLPERAAGAVRLRKGQALRRATVTTLSESGLYAVACVLLLLGEFLLAFACWLLAVLVFAANALPTVAGRKRRALSDRMGGTVVVRTHVLRDVARAARRATAEQGRRLQSAYADRRALASGGRTPDALGPGQGAADPLALPQAQPYQPHQPYPPGPVPPWAAPQDRPPAS